MRNLQPLLLAIVIAIVGGTLRAEEGLWLFNKIPPPVRQEIQQNYGFDLTPAFLDRLRLGSVHFGNGSGSFVSPNGLLFTNHHIAADCVQNLSDETHDYMSNGFYARSLQEERQCPGLRVRVLIEITDVTARVQGKGYSVADPAEANKLRKAEMAEIENACSSKGYDCQVVTLYAGGMYNLYRYKEYDDVRLVFAPESGIAFFGGDTDNFTFPRYCLDISFMRAYENGKPAKPQGYLRFSREGAQVGELEFVSGHPGTTGRLNTMSQLEFFRDVSYPLILDRFGSLIATAEAYSSLGAEQKRIARETIFGMENSQKAYRGFLSGLRDHELMSEKEKQERALREAVASKADLDREYGKVWDEISATMNAYRKIYKPLLLTETMMGRGSDLFGLAKLLVRYAAEIEKPNEDRLKGYNDAAIPNLNRRVSGNYPIYKEFEARMLTNSLETLAREYPDNAAVRTALAGRTAADAATAAIMGTKLETPSVRESLFADPKLIRESKDPLLELVRALEPEARRLLTTYQDTIEGPLVEEETKIARARFAVYGENDYPDATLTLRLAYGPVRGFVDKTIGYNPAFTPIGEVFQRATGQDPYILPEPWKAAQPRLQADLPFNYVTTADIHGGNSGSPAVNTRGEVVGIVFDGNLPSLPNRFIYQDRTARAVFVASQAIIEALGKVYRTDRLLKELGFPATK
ncbi:MAG: S46 family peptidase [Bryobacterales bacterium]|nr:S46 family peptidase [Bryobacterales bacterium]